LLWPFPTSRFCKSAACGCRSKLSILTVGISQQLPDAGIDLIARGCFLGKRMQARSAVVAEANIAQSDTLGSASFPQSVPSQSSDELPEFHRRTTLKWEGAGIFKARGKENVDGRA